MNLQPSRPNIWQIHLRFPFQTGSTKKQHDWFTGFVKRNSSLSIRAPEVTSQSKANGFKALVVAPFFNNLIKVMFKYKFTSSPDLEYGRNWHPESSETS